MTNAMQWIGLINRNVLAQNFEVEVVQNQEIGKACFLVLVEAILGAP